LERKHVPYNTGKVLIGSAYVPPPRRDFSADELLLQRVLLGDKQGLSERAKLIFAGATVLALFVLAIII
jgi:hypothetical protein